MVMYPRRELCYKTELQNQMQQSLVFSTKSRFFRFEITENTRPKGDVTVSKDCVSEQMAKSTWLYLIPYWCTDQDKLRYRVWLYHVKLISDTQIYEGGGQT